MSYNDIMALGPKFKLLVGFAFLLAIVAVFQRAMQQKVAPTDALRLKVRYDGMLETIEIVAARLLKEHPEDDDLAATKRIRDELMRSKLTNCDNFEATIITVVKRMRGNRDEPGSIQKWTD